jgi:hypothetical protein
MILLFPPINLNHFQLNFKSIIINEDVSEDTRLQMAIQLSLEGVNNPLTIDVEDYNISQLFN